MSVARTAWHFIEDGDQRLMRRVHRWRAPRFIRVWMILATRLGDGWIWCSLGVVLVLFGGPQRYAAVASATAAAIAGIMLFSVIKKVSRRQRPCEIERHCWSRILPPDQFSFPSGHSIVAFAVAVSVAHFYPALGGALLFMAVSVAVSRVILGMHYVSDVLVGSMIGVLLACVSFCLFQQTCFRT